MNNDIPSFINEPADQYNDLRDTFLTASAIKDYIRDPAIFRASREGRIPFKRSKAMDIGTALHTIVLEGDEAYNARYMRSEGPINDKTGKPYGTQTKAYKDWRESLDPSIELITPADHALVMAMLDSVADHTEAARLLADGTPEGVVRTEIEDEPVQVRIDWYNHTVPCMVDLKTTADLDQFTDQFRDLRYDIQAAWYGIVFRAVHGFTPAFRYIAVEKKAPHRVGVFRLAQPVIDIAADECMAVLRSMGETEPGRFDGLITIGGE